MTGVFFEQSKLVKLNHFFFFTVSHCSLVRNKATDQNRSPNRMLETPDLYYATCSRIVLVFDSFNPSKKKSTKVWLFKDLELDQHLLPVRPEHESLCHHAALC